MKKLAYQFCVSGGVFLYCLTTTSLSQAQITSDQTLSTDVNTLDNLDFSITGGRQAGDNLFHSFSQFSVPEGGSAIFDNALDVQNIFSRVTGSSISNIDGLIKANGNSNLFLLNPNGIIFGSNAQLSIGGSFIATTANQIDFADGNSFNATNLQATPLLTVSIPIGLQFRENPKPIVNQSRVADSSGFRGGLQVQLGKTLALIGGDIFLDGGRLTSRSGRIEIGSVAGNSFVSSTPIAEGWALKYENVQNFQDIKLSQAAFASTSGTRTTGESSGKIQLQGRQIAITDNSEIGAGNFGDRSGGSIVIKASESLEVSGLSKINSNAFSTGASGDIEIETKRLTVRDRSFIDTSSQPGADGQGGNLTVNASESVEVDGSGEISRLRTETFGDLNAGDLKVTTQRLILRDGGQIDSSTRSSRGNGGIVTVNAYQSVEVIGQGIGQGIILESGEVVPSGLFTRTIGDKTIGNAGSLNINTGRLIVRDGGTISVAADEGSTGQAGILDINANSLYLNQGTITAETGKTGGEEGANINLKISDLLKIENESRISARANGSANGGNIDIKTPLLLVFPPTGSNGSDIIANAQEGNGGNIKINAQGIFGIAERPATPENQSNDLDASSEFGTSGQVEIDNTIDPNQGLIELPETVVDPNALIAQNPCKRGSESEFVITGRGGLPPSLSEDLSSEATQVGLVEPALMESRGAGEQGSKGGDDKTSSVPTIIIPAQGWVFNERGEVVLVAYNPTVTGSQRLRSKEKSCSSP